MSKRTPSKIVEEAAGLVVMGEASDAELPDQLLTLFRELHVLLEQHGKDIPDAVGECSTRLTQMCAGTTDDPEKDLEFVSQTLTHLQDEYALEALNESLEPIADRISKETSQPVEDVAEEQACDETGAEFENSTVNVEETVTEEHDVAERSCG